MRKQLILLGLLLINIAVFGQHKLGLKVDGGISKINTEFHEVFREADSKYSPSWDFGMFYSYQFREKSTLNTELIISQINGKDEFENEFLFGSDLSNAQLAETKIKRNITYMCLPLYYGFKFEKLSINLGVQVSLAMRSGGEEKSHLYDEKNNLIYVATQKFNELNIDKYNFGIRAGIMYDISSKFSIDLSYYYGVNNIHDNEDSEWKAYQATVGLRYTLFSL